MKENEEEIERYLELMQKELETQRIKNMNYENEITKLSSFKESEVQNLVEYQLNLKEDLDRIFHLLSGHTLSVDKDGNEFWKEPEDDREKIFTEYGVKRIMNILSLYLNRNTLLSFYDEETIKWKIRDFGIELTDLIFNCYEHFFYYPKPEELYEIYLPIVKKEGLKINERELYLKCIQWSKEELQSKLRHYPIIILALVDTIHSAYLRALKGKERETLRERINVIQTTNQQPSNLIPQNKKFRLFNPKTW